MSCIKQTPRYEHVFLHTCLLEYWTYLWHKMKASLDMLTCCPWEILLHQSSVTLRGPGEWSFLNSWVETLLTLPGPLDSPVGLPVCRVFTDKNICKVAPLLDMVPSSNSLQVQTFTCWHSLILSTFLRGTTASFWKFLFNTCSASPCWNSEGDIKPPSLQCLMQ